MRHLTLSRERTPLAPEYSETAHKVVDVVGYAGIALLIVILIGCLPMIPDFIRYMKIRNM